MFQNQLSMDELAMRVRNMLQTNSITESEFAYEARLMDQMQKVQQMNLAQNVSQQQGMPVQNTEVEM